MKKICLTGAIIILFFIGAGGFFDFTAQARSEGSNPFTPQLPVSATSGDTENQDFQAPVLEEFKQDIDIQGVVWGTSRPQAIIEGQLYSEGDRIDDLDVTITEISKEGITIDYQGHSYFFEKRTDYLERSDRRPR